MTLMMTMSESVSQAVIGIVAMLSAVIMMRSQMMWTDGRRDSTTFVAWGKKIERQH